MRDLYSQLEPLLKQQHVMQDCPSYRCNALQVTPKMGLLASIGLFGIGANKSPKNAVSSLYLKPPREQGS